LGRYIVKIGPGVAYISRLLAELILASRNCGDIRLIVAHVAFLNLAHLAPRKDSHLITPMGNAVYALAILVRAVQSFKRSSYFY
jgi:hypothetical protein